MSSNSKIVVLGIALLLCYGHLCSGAPEQAVPAAEVTPMAVPYYAPPQRIEFCGEPVPLDNQDVRERFDREFTLVVYNHSQVFLWLKRKDRYFPWVEKQLAASNLPDDLKYVAVAESDLLHTAASPAGAVGPWQFVASTGSVYGLNQSKQVDERHDFELSSGSAFRYLQDLHRLFENWTLSIAAYNCGEKRIQDEMKRQNVKDYYSLKLPLETERYVFRVLAIKEVLSHPERYGYYLPKGAGYPQIKADKVSVRLPCAMPVLIAAEAAGVTYRQFKVLNPSLISDSIPQGTRDLKVPEGGSGKVFLARVDALKTTIQPAVQVHKVGKGETLSSIAEHYQVSMKSLKDWNNLKNDKVCLGQNLKIQRE